jgi:hypothetical protein
MYCGFVSPTIERQPLGASLSLGKSLVWPSGVTVKSPYCGCFLALYGHPVAQ